MRTMLPWPRWERRSPLTPCVRSWMRAVTLGELSSGAGDPRPKGLRSWIRNRLFESFATSCGNVILAFAKPGRIARIVHDSSRRGACTALRILAAFAPPPRCTEASDRRPSPQIQREEGVLAFSYYPTTPVPIVDALRSSFTRRVRFSSFIYSAGVRCAKHRQRSCAVTRSVASIESHH